MVTLPPLPIDDFVDSFYVHIAHGDEDHRAWLKRETQAWFNTRAHLLRKYAQQAASAAVLQERERMRHRLRDLAGDLEGVVSSLTDHAVALDYEVSQLMPPRTTKLHETMPPPSPPVLQSYWQRGFNHAKAGEPMQLPTSDGQFAKENRGYWNGYEAGQRALEAAAIREGA